MVVYVTTEDHSDICGLGCQLAPPLIGHCVAVPAVTWVWESCTPPPTFPTSPPGSSGELALVWVQENCRLTNSATTQSLFQGSELAHPNNYPFYELLESMKGPVLQIQGCRISMTQGNSRLS